MKKKLLVVHMSLYSGGAERSLFNFLQTLPSDIYDVYLMLFRKEGHGIALLPPNINIIDPPEAVKWLFWNIGSMEKATASIKRLFFRAVRSAATGISRLINGKNSHAEKQIRWKLFYKHLIPRVETHYDAAMAYLHGEITYFTMDKVNADRKIAWVHNDYSKTGLNADFDRCYYEKFDSVATISETCLAILKDTFPDEQGKFIVLPNIVSEKEIRGKAEEDVEKVIDPSIPSIVSIGRLEAQKAPEWSVEAARILKERGISFKWYWIGNGSLSKSISANVTEYGLENHFCLMGVRSNPYPYIKQCDVFVQNSRFEGKSIALDEAKILGKPIVITGYPTAHDQLADDEGTITDMDPQAVADGIEILLNDADKRAKLSETLLSRHYGCESEISKYIDWIEGNE